MVLGGAAGKRIPEGLDRDQIPISLSQARRYAEEYAYAEMDQDMYAEIERRQIEKQLVEEANIAGEALDPTLSIRK